MCWDRIIEAETSDRKQVQAPEPSNPKVQQQRPEMAPSASAPLTQDIPELIEAR